MTAVGRHSPRGHGSGSSAYSPPQEAAPQSEAWLFRLSGWWTENDRGADEDRKPADEIAFDLLIVFFALIVLLGAAVGFIYIITS